MESLCVIVLVSVFLLITFVTRVDIGLVRPTEIISAPVQFLAESARLDVSKGCTLINRRLKLGDKND